LAAAASWTAVSIAVSVCPCNQAFTLDAPLTLGLEISQKIWLFNSMLILSSV
jgi:hypothetical protein